MNYKEGLHKTIATYNKQAKLYKSKRFQIPPLDEIKIFSEQTNSGLVLDAGMGTGRDILELQRHGNHVIGIDISDGFLEIVKSLDDQIATCKMDIRQLGFQDGCFSGVWCCAVVSHLNKEDSRTALLEFNRVLCSGGILFLAVKSGRSDLVLIDTELDGDERYMTHFQKNELYGLLESVGFSNAKIFAYNEKERFGHNHRDINFWFCLANKT